jgi:hypothetical protein
LTEIEKRLQLVVSSVKQLIVIMKATITIKDELSFSFGDAVEYSMTLDFPSKFVSPREIIRERVFREVQSYNEKTPEIFNGLVQPTGAERTLNGFKMRERKKIDAEQQYKQAVKAFERNGFIMLVDDLQIETLDEQIEIEPDMEIFFLKLVPLVGG